MMDHRDQTSMQQKAEETAMRYQKAAFLQIRLSAELSQDFGKVCSDIGINRSVCVRLFIMKMVAQRRQMPEVRHATAIEQIDWAGREVDFYMPVFRMQKDHGAKF